MKGMKFIVRTTTDNQLLKQIVTIEDDENPNNRLWLASHNATDEIQNLIKQLEQYLKDRK